MSEPIGAFTERGRLPTDAEVRAALGPAAARWDALVAFCEAAYRPRADWAFLGRAYGWMLRFRKSGRTLLSLFPGRGAVTALVVVPSDAFTRVPDLGLTAHVADAVAGAQAYAEGRWVYASVEDDADVASVRALVELRTPVPAARRSAAPRG